MLTPTTPTSSSLGNYDCSDCRCRSSATTCQLVVCLTGVRLLYILLAMFEALFRNCYSCYGSVPVNGHGSIAPCGGRPPIRSTADIYVVHTSRAPTMIIVKLRGRQRSFYILRTGQRCCTTTTPYRVVIWREIVYAASIGSLPYSELSP